MYASTHQLLMMVLFIPIALLNSSNVIVDT